MPCIDLSYLHILTICRGCIETDTLYVLLHGAFHIEYIYLTCDSRHTGLQSVQDLLRENPMHCLRILYVGGQGKLQKWLIDCEYYEPPQSLSRGLNLGFK